jgi:hypothetical protein
VDLILRVRKAGCATRLVQHSAAFATFTSIYVDANAVRNDGKDLEGYSRDYSMVSWPPHEAVLKHTILPFTAPYTFISFHLCSYGLD